MNIVKESDNLYHVFVGDKDMWLSRLDMIELFSVWIYNKKV